MKRSYGARLEHADFLRSPCSWSIMIDTWLVVLTMLHLIDISEGVREPAEYYACTNIVGSVAVSRDAPRELNVKR